ncbi:conserved hypothetical protein [Coccidioides posadasii str. Silveira]|uniref:Uncharacterized protein n=1 Tax=Coccidioides posadasii (strain RMSCC 757 / Silveira) TaxID=443226 RepID=E9DHA5_COCPS|nr:conserved hypothetical protein [Coccidioides posadasii str. Silveira]
MRHQLAPAHWTNTSPPECMSGLFRTLMERSHSATVRWNRSDNESHEPSELTEGYLLPLKRGSGLGRQNKLTCGSFLLLPLPRPFRNQFPLGQVVCDNSLTSVFPIVRSRHRAYEPVITMRHILWYRDVHRRPHHRRMEARPSIGQAKVDSSPVQFSTSSSLPHAMRALALVSRVRWPLPYRLPIRILRNHHAWTTPVFSAGSWIPRTRPDHVWTPGETQTPCEWTENHELKQTNSFVNRGHVCFICFLKLRSAVNYPGPISLLLGLLLLHVLQLQL